MQILEPRQHQLLVEERRLLAAVREQLAAFEADPTDLETLRRAFLDLDDLFLLVVLGEFNAGKSAFINALLGASILEEGVTPTTTTITILRRGPTRAERRLDQQVVEIQHPAAPLDELAIVDTPGTNAIIREHERLSRGFVPRADLVLFVTSADRPFTESERAFLEQIREWGKKVVVVLNKVDLLGGEQEVAAVVGFIRDNALRLLGFAPEVFPVSARLALAARKAEDPDEEARLYAASRFGPLEEYLRQTLSAGELVRLKLLSPLGVAERISTTYLARAEERLGVLRADLATNERIERELQVWKADMEHDFGLRLQTVENILYAMNERGQSFFDQTLRLGRVFDLFNTAKISTAFEREVVADTPQQIDATVQELIDWMIDQEVRLWQSVTEQLNRRELSGAAPVARAEDSFSYDRRALLQSVGRAARDVVATYDREKESEALAQSVRTAVTQATLAGAGAVSIGALTLALASAALVDVTGLLAASVVAGLGLFIIPNRKRRAQEELRQRLDNLRTQLVGAMTDQFRRENDRTIQRVHDAMAPYSRFVRAELERVQGMRDQLRASMESLRQLRGAIEGSSRDHPLR